MGSTAPADRRVVSRSTDRSICWAMIGGGRLIDPTMTALMNGWMMPEKTARIYMGDEGGKTSDTRKKMVWGLFSFSMMCIYILRFLGLL